MNIDAWGREYHKTPRGQYASTPLAERFQRKVQQAGDCLEWTGSTNRSGYGHFNVGGNRPKLAHRVAWELAHNATIPPGLIVMHTCDNPRCVKPSHLRLGTFADNTRDMFSKGRGCPDIYKKRGVESVNAKLNPDAVHQIRAGRAAGETISALARAHGVSRPTINAILRGKTWAHVA
jgi:Pectobacterium phage endonuclease